MVRNTDDWIPDMPYEGDDRILQITADLCQQMNVANYNPTSVTWKYEVQLRTRRGMPVMRVLPWDQCILASNTVILPDSMRDKLEPDEWRPVITSALFYKKKLRTRLGIGIALRVLLFVALGVILFLTLPVLLPQQVTTVDKYGVSHTNPEGWLIASYLAPVIVLAGSSFLSFTYLKKIRLLADRDAPDIVGAPLFVAVLSKISGLDTGGYGKTNNRRGAGVSYLPTLNQRISDLQVYSAQQPS